MDKSIVPVGKYKGQPLEVLIQDPEYVEWLTAQAWFREKFPGHYTFIINNFKEASETPEHNELQAVYLDQKACMGLVAAILEPWLSCFNVEATGEGHFVDRYTDRATSYCRACRSDVVSVAISEQEFEPAGADLSFSFSLRLHGKPAPEWQAEADACTREKTPDTGIFRVSRRAMVEFKPALGDDYPAILREMKRISKRITDLYQPLKILVYRQLTTQKVTIEQIRSIFLTNHIFVVSQNEVEEFVAQIG